MIVRDPLNKRALETYNGEEQRPPVNLEAAEQAYRQLLIALGENPNRDGLRDTPRRAAKAMIELTAGRFEDPQQILGRTFEHAGDDLIVLRNVEFFSICEHHLLPFIGRAHIAYRPHADRVVGLSKLARIVDTFARRPQMQERMTNQIAEAIDLHAEATGVAVIVEGEHMCMKMRGVSKSHPMMQTVSCRGLFVDDTDARAEALRMLRGD